MIELTIIRAADGAVAPTACLRFRSGNEHWLCDDLAELVEAIDAGAPFIAHTVVGMRSKRIVVNPPTIETVVEVER
jgi:hypothetical protein